jgi:hypothetical protein
MGNNGVRVSDDDDDDNNNNNKDKKWKFLLVLN